VLVPVAWVAFRPDPGASGVSARFVQENSAPHWLAMVGLLLVVVSAVRSERQEVAA
jgi:hypothetical protein